MVCLRRSPALFSPNRYKFSLIPVTESVILLDVVGAVLGKRLCRPAVHGGCRMCARSFGVAAICIDVVDVEYQHLKLSFLHVVHNCFCSNTYSALNALAGHFNSFGATAPIPKKRLERLQKVGSAFFHRPHGSVLLSRCLCTN